MWTRSRPAQPARPLLLPRALRRLRWRTCSCRCGRRRRPGLPRGCASWRTRRRNSRHTCELDRRQEEEQGGTATGQEHSNRLPQHAHIDPLAPSYGMRMHFRYMYKRSNNPHKSVENLLSFSFSSLSVGSRRQSRAMHGNVVLVLVSMGERRRLLCFLTACLRDHATRARWS